MGSALSRPVKIWTAATATGGVLIVAGWLLGFTLVGAAALAVGVVFVAIAAAYAFASHQPRRRIITALAAMVALLVLIAPLVNLAAWTGRGFQDDNGGPSQTITPEARR